MLGGEQIGGQRPLEAAATDLQPDSCLTTPALDEAQTALANLHTTGFDTAERAEAEWAAERVARLQADHDLVEELRADGFEGRGYAVLAQTLADYGLPVIQAWIRRRDIYRLTAQRGRAVSCSDELRERLSSDFDDRQELASMVVARALVHFRNIALVDGGWTPRGGASLTTFFIGACIQVFPNEFRAWAKQYDLGAVLATAEEDTDLDPRLDDDPAVRVCLAETFQEALVSAAAYADRLPYVLAAKALHDLDYSELAQRWNTTEDALKQQVYRWRKQQKGGSDD
jgi:DNA-directed RNA polymerase specialized sigma24 family protein